MSHRSQFVDLLNAARRDDPELNQVASQGVDQHCPLPNQQIADTVRNDRAGPGALRVTPGLLHSGWPMPSRLQVAEATPEPKVAANRRREEFRYERWASEIVHVKPLDCKRIAV
jgi:hypothetical protein